MPLAFILAMQASGMIIDYMGKSNQIAMAKQGNDLEQAGINANIQNARLASEDESLQAMKQLRMNLGTQAAMYAARGIRGPATALSSNASIGNFNADERMRKINQITNETALRANGLISNLHQKSFEAKTMGEFRKSVADKIPTSTSAWSEIGKGFSKESGYGFGFSKVGG
jgi:hypothetical protein